MSLFFKSTEKWLLVSGNTYPHKEKLKTLGARFQGQTKTWQIPHTPENLEKLQVICHSVGGGSLESSKQAPSLSATPTGMSVSELVHELDMVIKQAFTRELWVYGEVQNLRMWRDSVFFDLADLKEGASRSATTTIKASIWAQVLEVLNERHGRELMASMLQDGMKLRLLAQVNFHKDRAQITLAIRQIDPNFTKGQLALEREQLLKELRQKGVDKLNPSRFMPAFTYKIGLISAEDSRAKTDFLDQLLSYKFPGEVVFFPTQMQGEKTLEQVQKAIDKLSKLDCDVIVITRGGGSLADLRWFDSKEIALKIANCKIPVVAAIGHHDDVSVAEQMAYQHEKTPTAAADFLIHRIDNNKEKLVNFAYFFNDRLFQRHKEVKIRQQELMARLAQATSNYLHACEQNLYNYQHRLVESSQIQFFGLQKQLQRLQHSLQSSSQENINAGERRRAQLANSLRQQSSEGYFQLKQRLKSLTDNLHLRTLQAHTRHQQSLNDLSRDISRYDPKPWLEKGWTRLETFSKLSLTSIGQVEIHEQLQARLLDGVLELEVKAKKQKNKKTKKQKNKKTTEVLNERASRKLPENA